MKKQWYAVHVYRGYEQQVKAALARKISDQKVADAFGEILLPTEKVMELAKGLKRVADRRVFPGYLLVRVALTDQLWHLIRSIPKVIGFVGRNHLPTPLSEKEVEEILQRVGAAAIKPRPKTVFGLGVCPRNTFFS